MWVGWVIGAAAAIASLIYFLKNRKYRELSYLVRSTSMLAHKDSSPELEVTYAGKRVNDPAITIVTVRSTGSQEICSDEFDSPMSVRFNEVESLLSVQVTNPVPDDLDVPVVIIPASNEVEIPPLLLNPGDGFDVQVLSDGLPARVEFRARAAGLAKSKRAYAGALSNSSPADFRKPPTSLIVVIAVFNLTGAIMFATFAITTTFPLTFSILSAYFGLGSFVSFWSLYKRGKDRRKWGEIA